MPELLKKTLAAALFSALTLAAFLGWIAYWIGSIVDEEFGFITLGITALFTFAFFFDSEVESNYKEERAHYTNQISELSKQKLELEKRASEIINRLEEERDTYKRSLLEKNVGFPTLLGAIDEYSEAQDKLTEDYLKYKKHPSLKGSEVIKEQSRRRRDAEFNLKQTKSIIEYYESIAPFLLEYKEDVALPEEEDLLADYTDEEKEDPATHFLTKQEYRKLSSLEKNQMALERYWKRPKSKWLIGRIYERYVGYLYEMQGYNVEYVGIFKGYEDLGRDLICSKGKEIVVIQCKNWSQFKTIYEKHIFQFFGTVFQYKDENRDKKVRGVFYSTTKLSDLAKRFAQELSIELKENFKMENNYSCIKCNISRTDGAKIYHLPFDQQYDNVKIEKHKGEFYCQAVQEAEKNGFRRAFRYKGLKKSLICEK
jgi:hypothetical protein